MLFLEWGDQQANVFSKHYRKKGEKVRRRVKRKEGGWERAGGVTNGDICGSGAPAQEATTEEPQFAAYWTAFRWGGGRFGDGDGTQEKEEEEDEEEEGYSDTEGRNGGEEEEEEREEEEEEEEEDNEDTRGGVKGTTER
jgi:hypothetical protein